MAKSLKPTRSVPPAPKPVKPQAEAKPNDSLAPGPQGATGLSGAQLRALGMRLGLPVAAVWIVAGGIASFATTRWVTGSALGIAGVATLLAIGVVIWAVFQAGKARRVASLVSGATSAEDRKAALSQLEQQFGKKDPAAVFAKAQLQLQEDPALALRTLEQIDLAKVMPNIADEARAQRAMIHLMLGQVPAARPLVDGIELKRHDDVRSRAMMAAVMGETWARSGQTKRATDTLALYDPDDAAYEQVRPQLWRARAFAAAAGNDAKAMHRALKKLLDQDPRLLGGFLGKKIHPLLMREAKKMLEQSGAIPRRMMVQRH